MEFEAPLFLEDRSPQKLHEAMLELLPKDIDISEGSFHYDATYPSAYLVSEMAQFILPMVMRQIWAQFASGEYLDYHAQSRKIQRRPAQTAKGVLRVTGKAGTQIPYDSRFSTVSKNGVDAVEFRSTADSVLLEESIEIEIEAVTPGSSGNVAADTVVLALSDHLNDLTGVTNPQAIGGGFDEESDEELRARILELDRSGGRSYIGNNSDYQRWAMSVPGVGSATVVPPSDDSGIVTIILVDSNGFPASEELCRAVYDFIMGDENDIYQRLAPVNAKLSVLPPSCISISIQATVQITPQKSIEAVCGEFLSRVQQYLLDSKQEQVIRYSEIGYLLAGLDDIVDYKDLMVNGQQINLALDDTVMPVISRENIVLKEGVV